MRSEVRHDERWQVTVHREEDSGWPDRSPVSPLSTRMMKPETVCFTVVAGHEHPESIEVFGSSLTEGTATRLQHSRYHWRRVPDWLHMVIAQAREYNNLTPADVAGQRAPLLGQLRQLAHKWVSLARHPSRANAPEERELLFRCATELEDVLRTERVVE